jgi:hypothetical protein
MNEPHDAPAAAGLDSDTGAEDGAGEGALVLHTSLLGELVIPSRAGHVDKLVDLAQRATRTQCVPAVTHPLRLSFRLSRDLGREPLAGDPETIAM